MLCSRCASPFGRQRSAANSIGPIGFIALAVSPLWMALFGFTVAPHAAAPRTAGEKRPAMGHRMTLRHHH